jgi:hypothetical protein
LLGSSFWMANAFPQPLLIECIFVPFVVPISEFGLNANIEHPFCSSGCIIRLAGPDGSGSFQQSERCGSHARPE